jgi:hypothetical protein
VGLVAHKYVGKGGYSEQAHCASCCTNDVLENVETEAPGGRARPTGNHIQGSLTWPVDYDALPIHHNHTHDN